MLAVYLYKIACHLNKLPTSCNGVLKIYVLINIIVQLIYIHVYTFLLNDILI